MRFTASFARRCLHHLASEVTLPHKEWIKAWIVTKAVYSVEKTLVNWLKKQGCEVKFG